MDPVSRERQSSEYEGLINRTKSGRFQPGISGNPKGRPKKQVITTLCEEIMAESREEIKAQILKTLTSKGMAGVLMFREVAERVEGKVTQGIEINANSLSDEELDQRLQKLLGINEPIGTEITKLDGDS